MQAMMPRGCIDGCVIVYAGSDGAIVWDASNGGCQVFLQGHDAGVRWADMAAQGSLLLTASADGEIKKWSLDTATCAATLPGVLFCSSALDAKRLRACMRAVKPFCRADGLSRSVAAAQGTRAAVSSPLQSLGMGVWR